MFALSEYGQKVLKRALILVAVSVLAAAVLIFVFTDLGMGLVFRLGVYLTSEEVDTGDTVYLEYYDAKARAAESHGVRFYMRRDDPDGWTAALDFLKFIKQNTEITVLYMPIVTADAESVAAYLADGDSSYLSETILSETEKTFIKALYAYNGKLPPQKRMQVMSVNGAEAQDGGYWICYDAYTPAQHTEGWMDVSVVYAGEASADPLFDLPLSAGACRFGSLHELEPYTGRLQAVSGNCGRDPFVKLEQAEFYFLISHREAAE